MILAALAFAAALHAAEVELASGEKVQGEAVTVRFKAGPQDLSPTASGLRQEAAFYFSYPGSPKAYAIFAIPLEHKPGPEELKVSWLESGRPRSRLLPLTIRRRPGKASVIHLGKKASRGVAALAEEKPRIEEAFASASGPPLWRGRFILPLAGTPTTPFGAARKYLPAGFSSYHRGMDLAVPVGVSVSAANDGEVVLARRDSEAYGGLIVISHGYDLTTAYMHLSRVAVKAGDRVMKGDWIGMSGAGGIATGPHLHWQMNLRGIAIDPGAWVGE